MSDYLNNTDPEENSSNEHQESKFKYIPESPYPLISPVAAAFLGLIGGFILYQFCTHHHYTPSYKHLREVSMQNGYMGTYPK